MNTIEEAVVLNEEPATATTGTDAPADDIFEIEKTPLSIVAFKADAFNLALSWLGDQVKNTPATVDKADDLSRLKLVRTMCVKARGAADEAYEAWNRPLLLQRTENIAIRDKFKADVKALEAPIDAVIKAEEAKRTEAKRLKDQAEADRIASHRAALAALQALPGKYVRATVEEILAAIDEQKACGLPTVAVWEEFEPQAAELYAQTLDTLAAHLDNAKQREELAALLVSQQAQEAARLAEEQERIRATQLAAELRDRIDAIKESVSLCVGMTAAFIQGQIDGLATIPDDFGDLQEEAEQARVAAVQTLTELHAAAVKREADDAELAALRKERADREAAEAAKAKAAAEEAERLAEQEAERVRLIEQRITAIANLFLKATGASLPDLEARIAQVEGMELTAELYAELLPRAEATKATTLESLAAARDAEIEKAAKAAEAQAKAAAMVRLQANASRLVDLLKDIAGQARLAGHDWAVLSDADSLIAEIEGQA
jgi:hypothetical protein